jgi:hypothetical protein
MIWPALLFLLFCMSTLVTFKLFLWALDNGEDILNFGLAGGTLFMLILWVAGAAMAPTAEEVESAKWDERAKSGGSLGVATVLYEGVVYHPKSWAEDPRNPDRVEQP